jgi:hypothetical protein
VPPEMRREESEDVRVEIGPLADFFHNVSFANPLITAASHLPSDFHFRGRKRTLPGRFACLLMGTFETCPPANARSPG